MAEEKKELSQKLKERFCADCKVRIQLFDEPYFEDRLKLFRRLDEYKAFEQLVRDKCGDNDDAFLAEYNSVKNAIIDYIKNSSAFIELNSCDMKQFDASNEPTYFGEKEVFKAINIGKEFISIDMVKANFSSLVHFSKMLSNNKKLMGDVDCTEFFESYDYELFMRKFTDVEHFIKSKYIRQVVFGACNPGRQTKYEKWLTYNLLQKLLSVVPSQCVYSLGNDEIIISTEELSDEKLGRIYDIVSVFSEVYVKFKCEMYVLGKIDNTEGYIKKIQLFATHSQKYDLKTALNSLEIEDGTVEKTKSHDNGYYEYYEYELKCLGPIESVFAYRVFNGEEIKDDDLVFLYNQKQKAKLLEKPDVKIRFTQDEK